MTLTYQATNGAYESQDTNSLPRFMVYCVDELGRPVWRNHNDNFGHDSEEMDKAALSW